MPDLVKLDNAIEELENQARDFKGFNSVYAEITKLKQDILDNLKLLEKNNQDLSLISNEVKTHCNETKIKIEEIYKDNKAFQKELDSSIFSRLEKHKSDIQVEIRNEGKQMESKLKEEFNKQAKHLNVLKILIFILIVVSIGLVAGFYLMK